MNDPTAGALFPGYLRAPDDRHLTDSLTEERCLLTMANTASYRLQSVVGSATRDHVNGQRATAPWLDRPAMLGAPCPIVVEFPHKVCYASEPLGFDRLATYLPARR